MIKVIGKQEWNRIGNEIEYETWQQIGNLVADRTRDRIEDRLEDWVELQDQVRIVTRDSIPWETM